MERRSEWEVFNMDFGSLIFLLAMDLWTSQLFWGGNDGSKIWALQGVRAPVTKDAGTGRVLFEDAAGERDAGCRLLRGAMGGCCWRRTGDVAGSHVSTSHRRA